MVLRSRPAPALPFLPEVKGLDSCPIALATVAAIKTLLRETSAISPGPRWREAAGATALRRGLHPGIGEALVLVVEADGEDVEVGGRRVTQDEDGV